MPKGDAGIFFYDRRYKFLLLSSSYGLIVGQLSASDGMFHDYFWGGVDQSPEMEELLGFDPMSTNV